MYEEILKPISPKVESASSGPDAIRMIRSRKFDLVSCDINLGITHPENPDGFPDTKIAGADGRTVIREVSERRAGNGIVVITGIDHDETISVVIRDEARVERLRMTLNTYIEEMFPGKNPCLKKGSKSTIQECIKIFKEVLSYEKLIKLAEALPHVVPPYTIDLSGKSRNEFDPILAIKSRKVRGVSVPITHKKDALFLYSLGKVKDTDPYFVTKEFVCGIYEVNNAGSLKEPKLSKVANTCIDSTKRRIRKLGLEPKELFVSIRESGWKLHSNVELRGFANVNLRSPGFGGEYQERDMMNDIEDHNAIDPNDERYLCDE
jgi:hypothetical protein